MTGQGSLKTPVFFFPTQLWEWVSDQPPWLELSHVSQPLIGPLASAS